MEKFPPQLLKIIHGHVASLVKAKLKRPLAANGLLTEKALSFFVPGVGKLSDSFTSERGRNRVDYLQIPAYRSAYLLYFLSINYVKAKYVLRQFPQHFWNQSSYQFLDLGCGPATATLAFLEELAKYNPKAEVEIHLVDQNKGILEDAYLLSQAWATELGLTKRVKFKTFRTDLYRFRPKQNYNLIFLHHILNEKTQFSALKRSQLLGPWLRHHLTLQGYIAVIEPALKRPTRELMALRDHLTQDYGFGVLAPCLHTKSCPMLAATRGDWCHFYMDWEAPESIKKLSQLIGTDNRHLKLSYVLFVSAAETLSKISPDEFIVVSNRMRKEDKAQVILCGPQGRYHLSREEQERSNKNQLIEQLHRGDRISIPSLISALGTFQVEGKLYLKNKDTVERLEPNRNK